MRIDRKLYMVVLGLLLVCGAASAQMNFVMAPISLSNSQATGIGGTPVIVNGQGKCLVVTSGIGALAISNNGKGVFGASCVETAPVAPVTLTLTDLKLYPNPTHNISILKCEGQFDVNLSSMVRVVSMEGRVMMSQMLSMKDLQAGYTLDASKYVAGTYVVTVDFMNQHYSRKLIKL